VNRYYRDAVAQSAYGAGIHLEFDFSPKTSLRTDWSSEWLDPDGSNGSTENHSWSGSAIWRYSRLLSFGPGVSWSRTSGDLQGARDAIGPTLSFEYQLSRKVALNGRTGIEWVDYENGGSDSAFTGALAANYRLNNLWSFNLGFVRGATADGSASGGFRETTAVRIGANRKVRRANAGLSLGYGRYDRYGSYGAYGADG
jgi:hypothetical protein